MLLTVQRCSTSTAGGSASRRLPVSRTTRWRCAAQVAQRELAPERVQRMAGCAYRARAEAHQGSPRKPGGTGGEIARSACPWSSASPVPPSTDSITSIRVCGLRCRSARGTPAAARSGTGSPPPAGSALPSPAEARARPLDAGRVLEQRPRPAVEHLPGRRQHRLAAGDLERLDAELRLELLHGVGDRRLALVQRLGGLRVAAGVDDRHQRAPLLERDVGRRRALIRLID